MKAARDLIEEALSTPSKDIEVITVDADKPQSNSGTTKTQSSSTAMPQTQTQTSINPWNQPPPQSTSSVWGKKRFSDVVPPTPSLLKQGQGLENGKEGDSAVAMPTRRISLPVKIPSFETKISTASDDNKNEKPDNQFPLLNPQVSVSTATQEIITVTKDTSAPRLSPTPPSSERPTPRHSVTLGPLSSVNEREEEDDNEGEPVKQRRSLSEPTVVVKPTSSVSPVNHLKVAETPSSLPPTSSNTPSRSSPVVTSNTTVPDNVLAKNRDDPSVAATPVPSVEVSTAPLENIAAPRTTRTMGIPTQAVKPIQVVIYTCTLHVLIHVCVHDVHVQCTYMDMYA